MTRTTVVLLVCVLACGKTADSGEAGGPETATGAPLAVAQIGDEVGIALDSVTLLRLGLETAPLAVRRGAPEAELPALIVEDPAAGTTVRSGIAGRLAEVPPTAWPGVGTRLETSSPIAQVGDARPVTVPRSGTVVRILAQPGELVQAGQPLLELVDYTDAIARIAWEEGAPPATLRFSRAPGGVRLRGRLLGPAPEADPLTRAPAWQYRLSGSRGCASARGRPHRLCARAGTIPRRGAGPEPGRRAVGRAGLGIRGARTGPVRARPGTDVPTGARWLAGGGGVRSRESGWS